VARGRYTRLFHDDDTIEPYYEGRYVHEFYRTWESWGSSASKHTVDTQVTHDLGLSYALRLQSARITWAFEASNLTDARVYDFFGIQRPGRAFALKLTGEL
jgi:outer membrane receptor protein involved in Fe transport